MSTVLESNRAIENAMCFPLNDVIARYCRDYELPAEIGKEHERELKRFLSLCSLNPDAHYGMKGPIDNVWHTFLLFTREYAAFCESVAGRFIHHVPETGDTAKSSGLDRYILFLEDYERIFGELPPPQYWPRPVKSLEHDANCSGCKGCAAPSTNCQSEIGFSDNGCSGCNGCAP